tara:strand:- start:3033 stop:3242 length:210 start_codon:yes stop_codon:yes gene_type:complete
MWKTILNNINTLILGNWKSIFFFVMGALAGTFLFSCAMTNQVVDYTQEVVTDAVEYVIGTDEEETPDAE